MSQQFSSTIASLQTLINNTQEHAAELIEALISEGKLHHNPEWAGHMTPSIDHPALLGQLLAGLHNGNLLSSELYPQLVAVEKKLLNWFYDLFGLHEGHFTHGSSYANLEALWQARDLAKNSSNFVYGSEATHYSIIKACQILGLEFKAIPTNEQGQIDTTQLYQACQEQAPIAIVATAGTTSSGAIDPIAICINIAREFNCWCHVDAAWGGALILLPEQTELTGINQADSICFDPHKALGQPRSCSIVLYKKPLISMPVLDADYLIQTPKKTLAGSYGGELFLPLWFSLLEGSEQLVSRLKNRLEQARLFSSSLKQQTDWQVFHSPTGIVCFKSSSDLELAPLEKQGLLSRSKIKGEKVWRVVFANQTTSSAMLLKALIPYF